MRKALLKIKYNFAYALAEEIVEKSLPEITLQNLANVVIVPVPLTKDRERWRGFNQSHVLAQVIAKKLSWTCEKDLIIKSQETIPQVKLKKKQRLRNMRGKFAVKKDLFEKYRDKKHIFCVFDDVITTGATIKECKSVLKRAGAENVYGLSICG